MQQAEFFVPTTRGRAARQHCYAGPLEPRRLFAVTAVDLGVRVTEFDDVVDVNGTVFFAGRTQAFVNELWRSDGTPQGTARVTSSISSVDNFTEVAGALFFTGREVGISGEGLYRTDGTADGGATLVRRFESIDELINVNGTLFFEAIDPATGRELWKSHGTAGTTTLVKDLNPGAGSSDLGDFYEFKDQLFFYGAVPGPLGWELYKSDGTPAGTGLVKDILPGDLNGAPGFFMEVGGKLFFSAQSSSNNYELWRTDGTAAGTVNVRDLPGDSGLALRDTLAPGVGLAITRTFDYPQELWRLDAATGNGTLTKVATLTDTANGEGAFYFADLGNGSSSAFSTDRTASGNEIWKTNGTSAGTAIVKDINPGAADGVSATARMASVGGVACFVGNDGASGWEVWRTDGTAAGTFRVRDILPGADSSNPGQLTSSGGKLFFTAARSAGPNPLRTLWVASEPPPTGSISGTVYEDANANGVRDAGERGLNGPRVFLDTDNDTLLDPWERTAHANSNGVYTFANVAAGAYTVRMANMAAWQATAPLGHVGHPVTLANGQALTGKDFGHRFFGPGVLGSIGGFLFDDRNASGGRDPEERLLPGRAVYLDVDNDWTRDATDPVTTTDVSGSYLFSGVSPGTYRVRQVMPAGWMQLAPANWGSRTVTVTASNSPGNVHFTSRAEANPAPLPPHVAGRHLFYNNSRLDGGTPGASPQDDAAIVPGARALLPGNAPGQSWPVNGPSHSASSKGVNGVMIDVARLPATAVLTPADFIFHVNTGAGWAPGPAPSVVAIRRGAGEHGTDRVTLVWPDAGANRAVVNGWLEVTVLANADTGLTAADVFYFGNQVGDVNGDLAVNGSDFALLAAGFGRTVAPFAGADFTGDRAIDGSDFALLAGNFGRALPPVQTTAPTLAMAAATPVVAGQRRKVEPAAATIAAGVRRTALARAARAPHLARGGTSILRRASS